MIPPRGPGSQSSTHHIQTRTDQVTTEKQIQIEMKNGTPTTLVSRSQPPSPSRGATGQGLMEAPALSSPATSPGHSPLALGKTLHCGPIPVPEPWGSLTLSPNMPTTLTVELENFTSPKSHLNVCCKVDTGWSTQLSAASSCSSIILKLRNSLPQLLILMWTELHQP